MALVSGRDSKQISARAVMLSYSRARLLQNSRYRDAGLDYGDIDLRAHAARCRPSTRLTLSALSLSLSPQFLFSIATVGGFARPARELVCTVCPPGTECWRVIRCLGSSISIYARVYMFLREIRYFARVYIMCVCVYVVRANLDSRYMRRTILTVAGAPE